MKKQIDFSKKVVYQIYPKSFCDSNNDSIGDLGGIIQNLDYLKSLNIDYLWLSPICKSPQKDGGYDISDYYQVDPIFGTNADYQKLIKDANSKNIGIIMDLVLNHVSDQHIWFKKACENNEKYLDYFIWQQEPNELISAFKKSAWTFNEQVVKYYLHLFDCSQPDLNWENPMVRKELYEMIRYWIGQGVSGFRLDVIDLIGKVPEKLIKAKGPNFIKYLEELCICFNEEILTVGECWGSTLTEANQMVGENRLSQIFHFNHLLTTKKKDKWDHGEIDVKKLSAVLNQWQNQYDNTEAIVMGNHDLPRLNSFWFNSKDHSLTSKLLITLFGLLKGTLYIYQGEEIGMINANFDNIADYRDVESLNKYEIMINEGYKSKEIMPILKRISRDNARTPFQWDDSIYAGFSKVQPWINVNKNSKKINLKNQLNDPNSVVNYYKMIIDFRKKYCFTSEKINFKTIGNVFSYQRGDISVFCNFGKEEVSFLCNGEFLFGNFESKSDLLRGYEVKVIKNV